MTGLKTPLPIIGGDFFADDPDIYLVKDTVRTILRGNLSEDQIAKLRQAVEFRESKDKKWNGISDLVDVAIQNPNGLIDIGGTFGPKATVDSVISFYTDALNIKTHDEGQAHDFGDLSWKDGGKK